jgi:peptide/nickel transport system ATP-binding protein
MVDALTAVGLRPGDVLGRFPHQLSGGQRQRINVARALMLRPKLLVADEPVSMVDASLRANILETLRRLQKDYGVSIIYITHDLTTAYHVSKSIVVLYRGSVMEAGDVDAVIKSPQHPYTRLLIESIPWPDINRRWGQTELNAERKLGGYSLTGDEENVLQAIIKAKEMELGDNSVGCRFSARCPFVMDQCKQDPPLFQLNNHQAASCYLLEGHPVITPERLSDLLPV